MFLQEKKMMFLTIFILYIVSSVTCFKDQNIIKNENLKRLKRVTQDNKIIVQYLVVIDSTVYNRFVDLYGNLSSTLTTQYINMYFEQMISGINQRFQNTLQNDQNLMISVTLSNVLILNNTPWTNPSLVSVTGYPLYNGKPTVLCNSSWSLFANSMNNMNLPFSYDYAVAVMDLDIWSNSVSSSPGVRTGTTAFSGFGNLCGSNPYTIMEFHGLSFSISNAARALGVFLGASADGTGIASSCSASKNNIMTPIIGSYPNSNGLNYFSNCSINSFKASLLTPNMTSISPTKQCLTTASSTTRIITAYSNTSYLLGQYYNLDQQCQLAFGLTSSYTPCSISDDPICSILYCHLPTNSSAMCIGTPGVGALDGTPCSSSGDRVCYLGNCVQASSVIKSSMPTTPCSPNPCQNGGICLTNIVSNSFVCNCPSRSTGPTCAELITTTAISTTATTNARTTTRPTTSRTTSTSKMIFGLKI